MFWKKYFTLYTATAAVRQPRIELNTEYVGCVTDQSCSVGDDDSTFMCDTRYDTLESAMETCAKIDSCDLIYEVNNGIDASHWELMQRKFQCKYRSGNFNYFPILPLKCK